MKHSKTFVREDGTECRIVAEYFPNIFGTPQFEYFALVTMKGEQCPSLYTVGSYQGKRELMSVARTHEMLQVGDELLKILQTH